MLAIHSLWHYSYRGKVTRPPHKELKIRYHSRSPLTLSTLISDVKTMRTRYCARTTRIMTETEKEKEKERILRPLSVQGGWRRRWQHLPTLINDARSQQLMPWGARLSFSLSLVLSPLTFFNRSALSTMVSPQHALKFGQPTAAARSGRFIKSACESC